MPKNQITQELEKEFSQGNLKPSQLKKSQSAEEFQSASDAKQELALLKAENKDLRIQISELDKLFQTQQKEHEQAIAQLTQANNALTDHNNELRLQHLKDSDALKASQTNEDQYFAQYHQAQKQNSQLKLQLAHLQKQLTLTQQDLKSAQRVIELRLNKQETKPINQPNYWKWISLFLGGLLLWSWLKGINN